MVSFLVVFSSLTPWASWGLNRFDSQPWPFISSSLYIILFYRPRVLSGALLGFGLLLLFSVIMAVLISSDATMFLRLRSIVGYMSIFTVMTAFIEIVRRSGFPLKQIVFVNLLWLLVALVELVNPRIVSFISAQRTTLDRGVTSLAAEPTFFAVFLIFVSWLLLLSNNYKWTWLVSIMIFLNASALVLLSQSSMGFLYLMVVCCVVGLYQISRLRVSTLRWGFSLVLIISVVAVIAIGAESSRLSRLLSLSQTVSPIEIIRSDASINDRVGHVVFSIHGALDNYLLPGGLDSFGEKRADLIMAYEGFFWYGGTGDKIMSWLGSFIYELGLLGVFALYFLYRSMMVRCDKLRRYELFLMFTLLLGAIPIAFSVVPLCFACFVLSAYPNAKVSSN